MTNFFYDGSITQPNDFIRFLIIGLISIFILNLIGYLIGKYLSPKRFELFNVMTEAFKQISEGNFNVKLNAKKLEDKSNPFSQVYSSINHMAEELQRMEQMRQEFISNVSHEIQSPLTSIKGFSIALQNESLDKSRRTHYLKIIETESARLSKLSDNLLKLTSLESDNHPFEPTPFQLDKQLQKVILSCEPQWMEKSIEIEVYLDEVNIVADKELMNQLWVNLISNSIKFTPQYGTIKVHLQNNKHQAVVTIEDSGIGISEGDQAHIFERFYRADKSRNRTVNGSGLGLTIVKKIIDLHQGHIRVESKVKEGCKMIVYIPFN